MRSVVLGVLLIAGTAAAPAAPEPHVSSARLDLKARFGLVSDPARCPPGVPPGTDCRSRVGTGVVRGLGIVTVSYAWPLGLGPPTCGPSLGKLLAASGRLVVAGKGEITFSVAEAASCLWAVAGPEPFVLGGEPTNEQQEFTITGGTGPFAAASGTGTLGQRWFDWSRVPDFGGETWTGTLEVPGLAFDVTPPRLSAPTAKTVLVPREGAESARVTFKVTAADDGDGAVPVACRPESGSRFEVGRTTVRCGATDSSGNDAKVVFLVSVKRRS